MADEVIITEYICSACGTHVTSEGSDASDHMETEHGTDPELGPQDGDPYLIPVESNPTLGEGGIPTGRDPELVEPE